MAFAVKDRVKEISSTTGTGSLTLGGAVTGYRSFNAALSNGDTTYYVIENPNTSEWETGLGTFTSPSTLARTTVLSSSTGSAVSFTAGAKNVFISLPATQFPAANTTVVGTDATQTLTNKSISGASNTVTNVSLTTGVTGTLPVANGGTGVTSSTGTGSVVLSASPTLTGTLTAAAVTITGTVNLSTAAVSPATMGMWNGGGTVMSLKGGSGGYSLLNNAVSVNNWLMDDSGNVTMRSTATLSYAGTTLAASVTGTGSMVLSASPTLTGTVTAPTVTSPAAADLTLNAPTGQGVYTKINSASVVATIAGFFFPPTNDAVSLGGSGNRWSNIYSVLGNFSGAATIGGALTYGGVTLSNSVTGTGSMVLSASPTLTGTLTAATGTFSGLITGNASAQFNDTNAIVYSQGTAGYGSFYAKGSGTNFAYLFLGNVTTGENGRITSDNIGTMYFATGAGATTTRITLSTTLLTSTVALNYGGVTLANSVTGTGSMVLSASPTLTGTLTAAAANFTTNLQTTGSSAGGGQFLQNDTNTGGQTWQIGPGAGTGSANEWNIYNQGTTTTVWKLGKTGTVSFPGALTYGGVTLSNSVTGTGSMVLSASPTLTGTLTAATANFSGQVGFTYNGDTQTLYKNGGGTTVAYVGTTGAFGGITTDALRFRSDVGEMAWGFSGAVYMKLTTSLLTLTSALNYGGVTLSNSVTGTGSMVLSASPSLTGNEVVTSTSAGATTYPIRVVNNSGTASTAVAISLDPGGNGANTRDALIRATNNGGNQITLDFLTSNAGTPVSALSIAPAGIVTHNYATTHTGATTLSAALTYGGVTLSNSVTGTGSMVLSASISNYLSGLTLSTAGSSATFSVAAGTAMDATNASAMVLTSALSKTTSAWAVGNANGALDTGAIANSTWYSVWEIMRTDTGVVDVLISTSATAPTMPASYNRKRRIGWIKTNGSAQWFSFLQIGDDFFYAQTTEASYGATQGATLTTLSMVPPSVVPYMSGYASSVNNTATSITIAPASNSALSVIIAYSANGAGTGIYDQFGVSLVAQTNSSRQIYVAVPAMSNGGTISSSGWNDSRGKDG